MAADMYGPFLPRNSFKLLAINLIEKEIARNI
jgi:hypothetical protein